MTAKSGLFEFIMKKKWYRFQSSVFQNKIVKDFFRNYFCPLKENIKTNHNLMLEGKKYQLAVGDVREEESFGIENQFLNDAVGLSQRCQEIF